MEETFKNKVTIITGGAEGIGFKIATKFLEQQAKVVILDINEAKGNTAVINLNAMYGDGKASFLKCDVTKDLESVSKKIFDTYKQVDVLINNAGSVDESSARKTLELNSIALIEWTMKFWEHMRKDKGGKGGTILNIGSIYSFTIDPYMVFYKASKFAVLGFTKCFGHVENYRKFGVRVLILCPGYTYSSLTDRQLVWDEQLQDFKEYAKTQIWQIAEQVGEAAVSVFKNGDSGSSWKVIGGELTQME